MQTSYSQNMSAGRPGLIYDAGYMDVISKLAEEAIPFGRLVVVGASVDKVKLPELTGEVTSLLDSCKGIAVSTQSIEQVDGAAFSSYPLNGAVSVAKRGRMYVAAEGSFVANTAAFVRFAVGAGVAQVNTITPTAVNSTLYSVTINGVEFTMTSDASATAAEIVTGLIAAINAGAEPVTASGTSTLILTADVAGTPFTVAVGANLANVATTANVATRPNLGQFRSDADSSTAVALPGARFINSGDAGAGDVAIVEFDLLG